MIMFMVDILPLTTVKWYSGGNREKYVFGIVVVIGNLIACANLICGQECSFVVHCFITRLDSQVDRVAICQSVKLCKS